jgi:nitroreductase/NAD-dependent dihydropyrimidine dehydrogenase PreA subunit
LCDLCGLCAEVCGRGIYAEQDGRMEYYPEGKCIDCGHCMAVCPRDALTWKNGTCSPELERERLPEAEDLLHFFRSRRSTRRFKKKAVSRKLLKQLAEAAQYAPTGTNKQAVKAVFVTDRGLIATLRNLIMARYGAYERHLDSPIRRFFLKTFVDARLGDPGIRQYLKSFMDSWRAGRDVLFHNAPVVVLLYAGREASTAKDDCSIALHQMILMAERLGLGSCLLGTAEVAFAKTPNLNDYIRIPRDRKVLAAACFGHPAIRFKRLAARKPLQVQWL